MSNDLLALQEELLKAIGNQKRLEIILLLENREMNVSEMTTMLGLAQANLSQHLTLLRAYRLVTIRKHGREVFYKLADDSIAKAVRSFHSYIRRANQIDSPLNSDSLFPIVTDPICGMRFSASRAYSSLTLDNKAYYFCASGCEKAFASANSPSSKGQRLTTNTAKI